MMAFVVCAVLAFGFASCKNDDEDEPTYYAVTVTSGTASPASAAAGTTVTITADEASTGKDFDKWTATGVTFADENAATTTFTMPASNVTVTATYKDSTPTYIGTKAPTEAKAVGDIVFSDGSATPYASDLTLTDTQKSKAIAVIFYVGTELNSDSDTTTSRTLGVGLVHNRRLAWCTSSANAYSKNITTIQCPASGSAGALTFTDDKNGSDNLSQIGTFLAANSSTDDTATEANYPAFYFAKNYASKTGSHVSGTDYAGDWYLPTIAELFQIWKSKTTVDAASALCGGWQFGSSYYWSSSQVASLDDFAYSLYFDNGNWSSFDVKRNGNNVCAVRAFN